MKRAMLLAVGVIALALYVWYDVYLFTDHFHDVKGNLEAAIIWATPTVAVALWRFEHRHRRRERMEQARHEERVAALGAIDAKVSQLHQHLGVEPAEGA